MLSAASKMSKSYDYGVACGDDKICKYVNLYFAGRLATLGESCDDVETLEKFTVCASVPAVTLTGVVTQSCEITITDATETPSCSPVAITIVQ